MTTEQPRTKDLTILGEAMSAYRCTECREIQEESHGPVYECGGCGTTFSKEDEGTHQCPDCRRFASKLADDSLECCNAEAEEIMAYSCEDCDALVPENEAKAHECGVEPAPKQDVETKPPFAIGQRVRVRPEVTVVSVHMMSDQLPDLPQSLDAPCYGPAKVIGYYTTKPKAPNLPQVFVAVRCDAHGYEKTIHADFLEAVV